MEVDIDDSFFQSESPEEQTTCSPTEVKIKEKDIYRARTCELGWYLKESDPSSVSTLGVVTFSGSSICTSISERPRDTCLQNDFMLLKYRADLFYSLKNFVSAAPLFEKVLELLPPLNAMVKREVNDSLARCYSQLGKHGQAKERAMQLVLPPHGSDASSWRLLSQCQKNAGDMEDHMISLQKCIALERQHGDFWMMLAEGYKLLQEIYTSAGGPESTTPTAEAAAEREGDAESDDAAEEWEVSQQLKDILRNTVSLFRPYFSWRSLISKPGETEEEVDTTLEKLANHLEIGGEEKEAYEDEAKTDHSEEGLKICNKDCPFFSHSHTSATCSLSTVLEGPLTPDTNNLCLIHSPFVILASRQVTVEEFIGLLKSFTKSKATTLLKNVCTLSECSCYLWARQLLIYSVRYSNSFAQVAMTTKLQQVEERLGSYDQQTVEFLSDHFSQRTVFQHSSKHSS